MIVKKRVLFSIKTNIILIVIVGFFKTHMYNKNNNFNFFFESPNALWILLDRSKVV